MTLGPWLSSVSRHVENATATVCRPGWALPYLARMIVGEVTHMNKSNNFLLNFASDLDGRPMNLGPFTPLDVLALRAALAAVALTVVLVLSVGFAGI
jgi:hypothetical protein